MLSMAAPLKALPAVREVMAAAEAMALLEGGVREGRGREDGREGEGQCRRMTERLPAGGRRVPGGAKWAGEASHDHP